MTMNLHRVDNDYLLRATNEDGLTLDFNGGDDLEGGNNDSFRPMQAVLAAVGSCSSIDIVYLLRKQRQELKDLRIRLDSERREESPRLFTKIHVHYTLVGDIDEKKAERACRLSMEKMCSVSLMLKAGGVEITWGYEVVAE